MRIHRIIIAVVLLAITAIMLTAFWFLTIGPGPALDFSAEYDEIREQQRPTPDTPDAWPLVVDCLVHIQETAWRIAGNTAGTPPDLYHFFTASSYDERYLEISRALDESHPYFAYLWESDADESDPDAEFARRVMQELDTAATRDLVDQLTEATWMAPIYRNEGPFVSAAYLGNVRAVMGYYLLARMTDAWRNEDLDEVRRSLRAYAALGRMLMRQPMIIEYATGFSMLLQLRKHLAILITMYPPPATWEGPIRGEMESLLGHPDWSHTLAADEFNARMLVNAMYTGRPGSDGRLLLGHARALIYYGTTDTESLETRVRNIPSDPHAPSRRELESLIEAHFAAIRQLDPPTIEDLLQITDETMVKLEAVAPQYDMVNVSDLDFRDVFYPPVHDAVVSMERQIPDLDHAVRVLLAIEGHRGETGAAPTSLADIGISLDGTGLRYRRLEDSPDEQGRTYLLYRLGRDGKDDGGDVDLDDVLNRANVSQ